jgi:hypothetical protein
MAETLRVRPDQRPIHKHLRLHISPSQRRKVESRAAQSPLSAMSLCSTPRHTRTTTRGSVLHSEHLHPRGDCATPLSTALPLPAVNANVPDARHAACKGRFNYFEPASGVPRACTLALPTLPTRAVAASRPRIRTFASLRRRRVPPPSRRLQFP